MKIFKQIGLFLSLLAIILSTLSLVRSESAAALAPADLQSATYTYDPQAQTITAKLTNGITITFSNNGSALPTIFTPTPLTFTGGKFCSGSKITYNQPATSGSISVQWVNNQTSACNSLSPSFSGTVTIGSTATPSGGGGSTTTTSADCLANSGGWSFAWAVCPVLDAASSLTTALVNIFEGQLSFSVSDFGNAANPASGAYKIHQSWSLIRDISTGLVVVIMLLIVFSQALSFGPFDAYTVRKLLPKLVASVILIQISWYAVVWVVDLVDAVAKGLADIMYFPFGGSVNMDLWHLLANAKLSNGLLAAMNWGGLLVLAFLGVAFLFTMLGIAFTAIIGLFFAVLTLVFRKILIITLLIFAPLALLAWILPGTERYWKFWRENFLKALMMFPIAVAIIAAGRIFAYVVGTQDNSQFLNLLFIVVGFFGPLFILPRTFRWGGQVMQMAGNNLMKVSSKVNERPKGYFNKKQEEYNHQKEISAANRLRQWDQGQMNRRQKIFSALRGDKFKAGDWDPAYQAMKQRIPLPGGRSVGLPGSTEMSRQQETKMQRFRAGAARAENEEREFAIQKLEEEAAHSTDPRFGPGKEDEFYKHVWEEYKVGRRSETEGFAALERLSAVGGEPAVKYILEEGNTVYDRGNSAGATAEDVERHVAFGKFSTRMAQSLFPKMQNSRYYKQDVGAARGIKAEELVNMAAPAVETMITNLNDTLVSPTATAADKVAAREGLENLSLAFQMAASSETTNRRISPGLRRAFQDAVAAGSLPSDSIRQVQQGLNVMLSRPAAPPTPGELKIQHEVTAQMDLPPATLLTPGSPEREAFKVQLRTSPTAFDTLANGLASGSIQPGSTYYDALKEMRDEAVRAGTAEAATEWNQKVESIQRAYNQHLDNEVTSLVASGVDPARARELASTTPVLEIDPATGSPRIDPATGLPVPGKTVSEMIVSLQATPPTGVTASPINKI